MAWTDPLSHIYVTGEMLTASTMNIYVKDNLDDLSRRTSPVNTYRALGYQVTSTYSPLADTALGANNFIAVGAVAVSIGSTGKALVTFSANLENSNAGAGTWLTYSISGASTWAARDGESIAFTSPIATAGIRMGQSILHSGLSAGMTTFTLNVRVDAGTGTWRDIRIAVTPLGA